MPYVDSVWDVAHTFVRVPAGAALAFAATSDVSPTMQIIAGLLGGGIALTSHGTKASLRATANLSPEPVTNWSLSLAEDALAVGGSVLAVFAPVVILGLVIIFLLIFFWIMPKVVRRFARVWRAARSFFSGEPKTAS